MEFVLNSVHVESSANFYYLYLIALNSSFSFVLFKEIFVVSLPFVCRLKVLYSDISVP